MDIQRKQPDWELLLKIYTRWNKNDKRTSIWSGNKDSVINQNTFKHFRTKITSTWFFKTQNATSKYVRDVCILSNFRQID